MSDPAVRGKDQMKSAMILEGVTFAYDSDPVLKGLDLELPKAALTAVVGPNGSGKSTLLKTIIGINRMSAGRILVSDASSKTGYTDLSSLNQRQTAQMIAYLPQQRNVPDITASRLVLHGRFPYLSYPRRYTKEDLALAEKALKAAGAEDLAPVNLERMSGGQRQKIYIAMALAQDTGLMLLDEPTTYLDIYQQIEIMKLLKSLTRPENGAKTVCVVMHDIVQALKFADCIAVLDEGRVSACASPEEIYESGVLDKVFGVKIRHIDAPPKHQYYVE